MPPWDCPIPSKGNTHRQPFNVPTKNIQTRDTALTTRLHPGTSIRLPAGPGNYRSNIVSLRDFVAPRSGSHHPRRILYAA
jgi:hypothetical protein